MHRTTHPCFEISNLGDHNNNLLNLKKPHMVLANPYVRFLVISVRWEGVEPSRPNGHMALNHAGDFGVLPHMAIRKPILCTVIIFIPCAGKEPYFANFWLSLTDIFLWADNMIYRAKH
jgi:hypothetical protein